MGEIEIHSVPYENLLSFVRVCKESCADPFPTVLTGLDAEKGDRIYFDNIQLKAKSWEVINLFHNHHHKEGRLIRELIFVNVSLTDKLAHHLSLLIKNCPFLEVLDVSKNYLTSKALPTIATNLQEKEYLRILLMEDNFLTHQSMDMLCYSLSKLPRLLGISFARNSLTEEVVQMFSKYILTFQSKLQKLDLSYNIVGDKMAGAVSALFCNDPSHLISVNLSYCGLTDKGVRALVTNLHHCPTLKELFLNGNFFGSDAMQQLSATINELFAVQQRNSLIVSFGGSVYNGDSVINFSSNKCLKSLSAQLTETHYLDETILQKMLVNQRVNIGTVCLRADDAIFPVVDIPFLLLCLQSGEMSLWTLCQTQSSSLTTLHDSVLTKSNSITEVQDNILFATFVMSDPCFGRLKQIQTLNRSLRLNPALYNFLAMSADKNSSENIWAYSRTRISPIYETRAAVIYDDLVKKCSSSDPTVRMLGVRAAFCSSSLELSQPSMSVSVVQTGFGGHGLTDDFIPVIAEQVASQVEPSNATAGVDDPSTHAEEIHKLCSYSKRDQPESIAIVDGQTMEDIFASENQLREVRQLNERLILAVRRLYETNDISKQVAQFWEGIFGNKKYARRSEEALLKAMEVDFASDADFGLILKQYSHLFPAIARRLLAYQFMFSRDMKQLSLLLSKTQTDQGGEAQVLGQRLATEIGNLQEAFRKLKTIARTRKELPLVENFLLDCGRLGYSGDELFQAVDLRARLVALRRQMSPEKSFRLDNDREKLELDRIKERATISNLLVSRDFDSLEVRLQVIRHSSDDVLRVCEEARVAEQCITDREVCFQQLRDALRNCLIEQHDVENGRDQCFLTDSIAQLDAAMARCAYRNFYFPQQIQQAVQSLDALSRNPAILLQPVLHALRSNDLSLLEKGFENISRLGLHHVALDSAVCSKINAVKSKIVQDDTLKESLVKLSLALKNGFAVPTGEVLQLLRRATASHFDVDPGIKPYYKILVQHSKRFTGLQRQEKLIQELIERNDVIRLSKLLSGRGTGRLVMCFPTAFAMEQWFNKIKSVATTSIHEQNVNVKDETIIFKGIFEKAARNESGELRHWRRRFFVLGNVHLAYFTKPGGKKKGFIRVLSGGVRKMSLEETSGRPFCLELEEGRDLTQISPDLMDEARRRVRLAKIQEVERGLNRGIRLRSAKLLSKMLQFAKQLGVMLDFTLMTEARVVLRALRETSIKRDLYLLSRRDFSPKSLIVTETLQLAESLHVDPTSPSLQILTILQRLPDFDQEVFRVHCVLLSQLYLSPLPEAHNSLQSNPTNALGASTLCHWFDARLTSSLILLHRQLQFSSSSSAFVSSSQSSQSSLQQQVTLSQALYVLRKKRQFVALMLQLATGVSMIATRRYCLPTPFTSQLLRLSITLSASLRAECEALDLARVAHKLLFISSVIYGGHNDVDKNQNSATGDLVGGGAQEVRSLATEADLQTFLKKLANFPGMQNQYRISKYPLLRSSVQKRTGILQTLGITGVSSPDNVQIMMHSAQPIAKSLLKHDKELLQQLQDSGATCCLEMFAIVQVLMGDAVITALPKSNRSKLLNNILPSSKHAHNADHHNSKRTLSWVFMQLLMSLQGRYAMMTDELFFQLCKQLSDNKVIESRLNGWLLFSLLLQFIPVSTQAIPFISHFVQEASQLNVNLTNQSNFNANNTKFRTSKHISEGNTERYGKNIENNQSDGNGDFSNDANKFASNGFSAVGKEDDVFRGVAQYVLSQLRHQISIGHKATTELCKKRFDELLLLPEHAHERMFQCVFSQELLSIDVVLLTGEIHCVAAPYGQIFSSQELLKKLLRKVLPMSALLQMQQERLQDQSNSQNISGADKEDGDVFNALQGRFLNEIEKFYDDPQALLPLSNNYGTKENQNNIDIDNVHLKSKVNSTKKGYSSNDSFCDRDVEEQRLADWLLRGFRLATIHGDIFESNTQLDLRRVVLQTKHANLLDWQADLQWPILCSHLQMITLLSAEEDSILAKVLLNKENVPAVNTDEELLPLSRLTLVLRYDAPDARDWLLDEFLVFGDEFSEKEQLQRAEVCRNWLSTTESKETVIENNSTITSVDGQKVCPFDFFRVDLIFAEDARFVNSRLAPLSNEAFHYLIALQISLCWTKETWVRALRHELLCDTQAQRVDSDFAANGNRIIHRKQEMLSHLLHQFDLSLDGTDEDLDKRESHFTRSFRNRNVSSSIEPQSRIMTQYLSTASRSCYLRENVYSVYRRYYQDDDNRNVDQSRLPSSQMDREGIDSDGRSDVSLDSATVRRQLEKERQLYTGMSHNNDAMNQDRDSDSDSDVSSSYVSSESEHDSDAAEEMQHSELLRWRQHLQWQPTPLTEEEEVSEMHLMLLRFILEQLLGIDITDISQPEVSFEQLWPYVAACHQLCIDCKIDIDDAKYRYLLKRAFHEYLCCSCAVYGDKFVSTTLSRLDLDPTLRHEQEHLMHFCADFEPTEIVLSLSRDGIRVLQASDWSLLFACNLWDIQDVDWEVDTDTGRIALLELNINGLKLLFEDSVSVIENSIYPQHNTLHDTLQILSSLSQDALVSGRFPDGASLDMEYFLHAHRKQTGVQSDEPTLNNLQQGSGSGDRWEMRYSARFSMLQQHYLNHYSVLPTPPLTAASVAVGLRRSEGLLDSSQENDFDAGYFSAPPSRRDLAAQERDEEERMQRELAKLALEAQLEKSQQLLAEGREAVRRKRHTHAAAAHDAEDANNPNSNELSGDVNNVEDEKEENNIIQTGHGRRKHRSVFSRHHRGTEDLSLLLAKERVSVMVCGVSQRETQNMSFYVSETQFMLPTRQGGQVMRHSSDTQRPNSTDPSSNNTHNNNGRRTLSRQSSHQFQSQSRVILSPSLPLRHRPTTGMNSAQERAIKHLRLHKHSSDSAVRTKTLNQEVLATGDCDTGAALAETAASHLIEQLRHTSVQHFLQHSHSSVDSNALDARSSIDCFNNAELHSVYSVGLQKLLTQEKKKRKANSTA